MRLPVLAALLITIPMAASLAQMPTGQTPAPAPAQTPMGQMPAGHPPINQNGAPAAMNHSGTVAETIPAAGYVYIHVNGSEGDQWLAAPSTELKNGANIKWADGMLMQNFHSKTLNRTFDKIFFVQAVEEAK